ncbi:hypothetical protein AGRA3207_003424 [Actinomadura graeca]|uniref:Chromosome partition protein Smc n=1 Tax=Actinomadura graeca TaxID=2750812 RepID=A0ABX8QUW1_9ACTN|nr:hypothetical protein [Actinomadura graeca]QXJ22428.1 hypothetical protein AGRA3207_003424 [Actinomadura graeca]
MTDDVKAALAAVLAEDGPAAALTALRLAADWSARALAAGPGDDVAAFQAVAALDDALEPLAAVTAAVPALVEAASPGRPVHDHLRERQAELTAARDRLAADRAALDELDQAERALAEQAAEHDRLRDRVAGLRRLRALADEVEALRDQAAAFDDRTARHAAEAEDGLAASAADLLRLTREQIALLDPRVRAAVEDAAAADTELAGLRERLDGAEEHIATSRAELESAAQGFDRLRARRDEVIAPLRAYRDADRDLLTALNGGAPPLTKETGLERADRELADIGERLGAIDEILGRVLTDHVQAHERARTALGWSG